MDKQEIEVHKSHCTFTSCKYGDLDCPVAYNDDLIEFDFDLREKSTLVNAAQQSSKTLSSEPLKQWLLDNKESVMRYIKEN